MNIIGGKPSSKKAHLRELYVQLKRLPKHEDYKRKEILEKIVLLVSELFLIDNDECDTV